MEDKHAIVSSFQPLGGAGAVDDGVQRSYFGVFDGAHPQPPYGHLLINSTGPYTAGVAS